MRLTPGAMIYHVKRFFRGGLRSTHGRVLVLPQILKWAPFDSKQVDHPFELHLQVCQHDWMEGLWALASFVNVHGFPHVAIHEDGSVPTEALEAIQRLFPHARLITRSMADEVASKALKDHPRCWRLRQENPYSLKLFDVPLMAKQPRVMVVDADILFFHPCDALLEAAHLTQTMTVWNRDWREGYSLPYDVLSEQVGFPVENLINSGLGCFQTDSIRWDDLERWLAIPGLDHHPYPGRVEQTLVALTACQQGFRFLPPEYDVNMSPQTPEQVPSRHYTGEVRPLFYSEGLSRCQPHRGKARR